MPSNSQTKLKKYEKKNCISINSPCFIRIAWFITITFYCCCCWLLWLTFFASFAIFCLVVFVVFGVVMFGNFDMCVNAMTLNRFLLNQMIYLWYDSIIILCKNTQRCDFDEPRDKWTLNLYLHLQTSCRRNVVFRIVLCWYAKKTLEYENNHRFCFVCRISRQ